jgi:iron complex transport system ATP-binding protein
MLLETRDLRFARRDRTILDGVSLAVEAGELLAVIGPNGAGKSTLLHLLSGALSPAGGSVVFQGRPLGDWPRADVARRRAVLPQASELSFPFRALEVVLMGRSAHAGASSHRHDLEVAVQALEAVDARHLAERIYPTLSGGERQRVQLARVLAQIWPDDPEPRLLLLDEPTNNLDLSHQHALLRFARRLADRGLGVLAVLHDPNLAALHADRLAVLAEGHILREGPVSEVLTEDTIGRAFGLQVAVRPHPLNGTPQLFAI